MKDKKINLPQKIKVKLIREKSGNYFAELPEYDIFTEAKSIPELIFNVNDLVYTFFDVPKKNRGKILYAPPVEKRKEKRPSTNLIAFSAFTQPNFQYGYK